MRNRRTRKQKNSVKSIEKKEITRSNLRICELEKEIEKQKNFIKKSLVIRNLKVFRSVCNFFSPYIIFSGITFIMFDALGSGSPFVIDEFDKYKTYSLNYETDDLIEYKENYEYNINVDNVLKITTPWVLNKDNKYERVVKKYSVIYNTDKELIDKLLLKDIEYIDEHYQSREIKKEITNEKLYEDNDYIINANLTVMDKNESISVKESKTENDNVIIMELITMLLTGTLTAFLRKFRLKESITSVNSEYHYFIEQLSKLEGELINEKEKIKVLMKKNNRVNRNGGNNE